ncbi:hypothetical protein [Alistipes communis]|nr:hypothetical protein [Alistipes communis]
MKGLKFLMTLCSIALVVFIFLTLWKFMTGGFIFAAVGAVASVVLFAILTVLRRQLRIMKIMNTEDFEYHPTRPTRGWTSPPRQPSYSRVKLGGPPRAGRPSVS